MSNNTKKKERKKRSQVREQYLFARSSKSCIVVLTNKYTTFVTVQNSTVVLQVLYNV